jgi:hypothetical protein
VALGKEMPSAKQPRQRWTIGKIFLCRGPGTLQILAVGKGGRRDGGHLPLAFAERPAVWRSGIFLFFF